VTYYIASDVHLRMDRPERGQRFANWVRRLDDDDSLLIAGDLCDFWMGTRCRKSEMMECDGLRALVDFRARRGTLAIMPGNHDLWLCPFYERALGATIVAEPFDTAVHGIRLHVVHGHRLGARRKWKAWMETREFFTAFGHLPSPVAGLLDQLLERKNLSGLDEDELRHLAAYRRYTAEHRGLADIIVIGHVHRAVEESGSNPRMIVLGGWQQRSSYLSVDLSGAFFHVPSDESESPSSAAPLRVLSSTEPRCPTT
jgi:UDP-2,3-diacylglucosamine hydrolase